ncbi:hypothetical protein, partial [uncultured Alistipes sp.]|uniref:hypothetical protein n=1 Tax=uncultured Alistipes sp. TaxID=538949 RepID=UPI0026294615
RAKARNSRMLVQAFAGCGLPLSFSIFHFPFSIRCLFLRSTFRIFDFVQDTPARQNANKLAFALAYSYLWLRRRYCASEKMQASLRFSLGLFVSLPENPSGRS